MRQRGSIAARCAQQGDRRPGTLPTRAACGLVVNLKTATTLRLMILELLLTCTDGVIE